jgi:rhamnose transport system ATP-binding protein
MMVGRSVDQIFPPRSHNIGDEVLTVEGYSHPTEFADIGFTLRKGEILGFYGLVGAGRSEVMQALFGITRPSKGGLRIERRGPRHPLARRRGRAGHRLCARGSRAQGAVIGLPIFQNVTLPSLGRTVRAGFLRLAEEFAWRGSIRSGSTCARRRWIRTWATCRAATSRRW